MHRFGYLLAIVAMLASAFAADVVVAAPAEASDDDHVERDRDDDRDDHPDDDDDDDDDHPDDDDDDHSDDDDEDDDDDDHPDDDDDDRDDDADGDERGVDEGDGHTPQPELSITERAPAIRVIDAATRWEALEQSIETAARFEPGVGDGPVSFYRSSDEWQRDELILFQMHSNGHTYRHHGTELGRLSPGRRVFGPHGIDAATYAGIASVVQQGSAIYGFVHQESEDIAGDPVASVGLAVSEDNGYTWNDLGTIVRGQDLQPDGFRGATGPSVVIADDEYVMLYTNRFGNGRFDEVWRASAPLLDDGSPGEWTVHGMAFQDTGEPHFYSQGVSLVWSTVLQRWVAMYQTDTAIRYRTTADLVTWSEPITVVTKPQQWSQTSGARRWYPTPIDPTQDSSTVIGVSGQIFEHVISVTDLDDRYPTLSPFVVA